MDETATIDPIALVVRGTEKVVAYACGKCHVVASSEEQAKRCCAPYVCDECGRLISGRCYTKCSECIDKHQAERDRAMLAKANKVAWDADNCPSGMVSFHGEWHESIEAFVDYWMSLNDKLPPFVWAGEECRLTLDAEQILRDELERQNHYEDEFDRIGESSIASLQKIIDEWLAGLGLKWFEQSNTVILLDGYPVDDGDLHG